MAEESDDGFHETQWTDEAREEYEKRAAELVAAVRAHVALTLDRRGRQVEALTHFPSAERLVEAAAAFDDAEFDWCGSLALGVSLPDLEDDEDDDDDDDDEEDDGDDEDDGASTLRVSAAYTFRVLEREAVVRAGREAYATCWPQDTPEDAEYAVHDVVTAAGEIVHAHGMSALENTDGLELFESALEFAEEEPEPEDESA
ncbi:hypothetical protein [Mumia zhuanghuii]|uniref:hypothetical protein n=1 Tax=Mumia zhuanghuii TaxID=2585211 RepID=UPI001891673D|nr:hypothetical protein [Mumia zhuanghuii]